MILGRTAIVFDGSNYKPFSVNQYGYRCRGCNTQALTGNTPADQYQKQKIIQNTVRVYSSLYTMNLGSLSSYVGKPKNVYNVGWNQQSDRAYPSVQPALVKTGFNNSLNNRHHSYTSSRPGTQTPGGIGCDIKHNSYDRFLNKLKGKTALRRGVIPPTFGLPSIPFNPAFPVYGGKQFNTSIVSGCNCPAGQNVIKSDTKIYNNPYFQDINDVVFKYGVGMFVYAYDDSLNVNMRAEIIENLGNNNFVIKFDNETGTVKKVNASEIVQYYPCNCNGNYNEYPLDILANGLDSTCYIPGYSTIKNIQY
jgi:hypothetical protein